VKSIAFRALLFVVALSVRATFAHGDSVARSDGSSPSSALYADEARQVMEHVQKTFWDPARSIYTKSAGDHSPDYVWRQAAAFSALLGAARHDPAIYRPILAQHFHGLETYWDTKAHIPGYEPAPTRGNGHDKYYDDNAWIVITFVEAFELTHERAYLTRAQETGRFVLSGWDEKQGGGIWWHASHKDDSKNTCANGPAAVGFLYLARVGPSNDAPKWVEAARKAIEWTSAKLQAPDGLFDDRIIVTTGEVKRGKLTYNSALMLRANLDLYRQTGRANYLDEAKRIAKAADFFCNKQTGVFRDPLKWSQFMVEADLDLYHTTHEAYLLRRARTNADAYFADWKKSTPLDMMSNVGIARILYLLAETKETL
jgi:hypothetical protein